MNILRIGLVSLGLSGVVAADFAHAAIDINSNTFGGLRARSIGPAVMSGRIAALDVHQSSDPLVLYVGTASGGVWKSDDGGITYDPIFDKHVQSIGAVRIDPGNHETIWVGTGESWVRNTVSIGDGVYKSTNAGDDWKNVGLGNTEHISEIEISHADSDTVFVCALGTLWSDNEERGVFRTTDGGQNWEKVLYVDQNTGCSDIVMHPENADVLYAGMWEVQRYPDFFESGGPGSGLYRSVDGGENWERLESGLPETELGRISVTVAPSNPDWVYSVVESEKTALYRSENGGDDWKRLDDSMTVGMRPFYFGELKIDPTDHLRVYKPGFMLGISIDGGESFSSLFGGMAGGSNFHPDLHAIWINPDNPEQVIIGTDGGVYISEDKARRWRHVANMPVSQFYHVAVDNQWPYNVYGGLQDNGSWMGPSRSTGGIQNRDWSNIGFGDGFWAFPDPTDDEVIYSEYQGGQLKRVNRSTSELKHIAPVATDEQEDLRFNWNTPIHISPNKKSRIYYGSQYLHVSDDRGDSWKTISPDLTTDDPQRQRQLESGGLTIDNSTAENNATIYTISESPVRDRVVWVGSDDGLIHLTRNAGKSWDNVTANLPGVPANTWVSRIEASPFDEATAYVTLDGHRTGDMTPYLFKTEDFGKSWRSLVTEDIRGYAWVIKQDPVNPDLLYLGTEFGLYISLDDGQNWARFKENLPMVAVHDIVIHPTEHDVVLGTHGRGVYIIDDITPLRNLTTEVVEAEVSILPSRPSYMVLNSSLQEFTADDSFAAPNPSESATISYYLKKRHMFGDLKLEVYDQDDNLITTLPGPKRKGINRVQWPMRFKSPKFPPSTSLVQAFGGPRVPEGEYRVRLIKGKETLETTVKLIPDPRSRYSARERRQQQQLALDLYDQINSLTHLSDNLILVRDAIKANLDQFDGGDRDTLQAYHDDVEELRTSLSASGSAGLISGEEKLREKLGNLYGHVSSFDGAPTDTQIRQKNQIQARIDEATDSGNVLLGEPLVNLNALFESKGLAAVETIDRDSWNEKEGMQGFTVKPDRLFMQSLPFNALMLFSVQSSF